MIADVDALNYPYIRIRDVNWLKRTLLFFPHVVRITPDRANVGDDPEVDRFCWLEGRRGLPLLRRADLNTHGVRSAQQGLMRQIRARLEDDRGFESRFRRAPSQRAKRGSTLATFEVWRSRDANEAFQLHGTKIVDDLRHFLMHEGLAWYPRNPHGADYVEMEPELGQAVMATIAYACAADEGLELVTEFPRLFSRTINQPRDRILDACLGDLSEPDHRPREEFAEFVIHQSCDASKLTPERIQALSREWDAITAFKEALQAAAASLPEIMNDEATRNERLRDAANDILRKWREDKANLGKLARDLFGDGFFDPEQKLLENLADAAFGPEAAGALTGGITSHTLLGAMAGLAIGVVFRVGKSVGNVRRRQRESPFRYLTMLEEGGVGLMLSP